MTTDKRASAFRGIDGALKVYRDAVGGMFASESLRRVHPQIEEPRERVLAATLSYAVLRRLSLWKHIIAKYCRRPIESLPKDIYDLLVIGTAGLLELERFGQGSLVNAIVNRVKRVEGAQVNDAALANAVLRTVIREAPDHISSLCRSTALRDVALARGCPGWAAAMLNDDYGVSGAKEFMRMFDTQPYLSMRITNDDDADILSEIDDVAARSEGASPIRGGIRFVSNPFPADLPGYAEGRVTPMSESSMIAVDTLLSRLDGRKTLLDMCTGRGIKGAQLLARSEGTTLESWDRSERRLNAARAEYARLNVSDRVRLKCGDALELTPNETPDAILLDAPCSGSGTWRRHPEAKWRLSPENVRSASELQAALFNKAADILTPGGILMYCTCSVFREENEQTVGAVLSCRSDLAEIPVKAVKGADARRGRPYGTLIMPQDAWTDGFYIALFVKKS